MKLLLASWVDVVGIQKKPQYELSNNIHYSFIMSNMNWADFSAQISSSLAKCKAWITARIVLMILRMKQKSSTRQHESLIIIPPTSAKKKRKKHVWADLHCIMCLKCKQHKGLHVGLLSLMSPCRKYDFIIKNKMSLQPAPVAFFLMLFFQPKRHSQQLHNSFLDTVTPRSIYSQRHPADVMHDSSSNLTPLSNMLHEAATDFALSTGWVLIPLSHNKIKE